MENEKKAGVVLRKLCLSDAREVCHLLDYPEQYGTYCKDLYANDESPEDFTRRLLWLSKCMYTIRLKSAPTVIVGACEIYKGGQNRKEIYVGGTLLPEYRDKGLMLDAFNQMLEMARYYYGIYEVKILLNTINDHVISVMEKLGFAKDKKNSGNTIYSKILQQYIPRRTTNLLY
ncbi:GNAT family N-acetyltransferase [Olivibacter domesticus]|uniref:Acetyltransferase (GNAT) domain-containing protein n=1 Tax=Olivibacter domesticus TaxID=407022 RepID=A0A1H7J2N4_OLID1|nr:GNAT family N-acetyltransferase [Olivibacter domesticus]SEK68230.1 Acetyltransferase (GNAT) domain-containing protein [Olivibacter domesticus]